LKALGGSVMNMDAPSLIELLALLLKDFGNIGERPFYFWTVLAIVEIPLFGLSI